MRRAGAGSGFSAVGRSPLVAMAGLVLAALLAWPAQAETLAPGDALPALAFEDQHGESHALDASLRALLFTRDMDAGRIVREALEEEGAALLANHPAVYVADVSRMPGIVRRTMAIPRMRDRPYPILLDQRGDATATFPGEAGRVTLLRLRELRIEGVEFIDAAETLRAALAEAAPAADSTD